MVRINSSSLPNKTSETECERWIAMINIGVIGYGYWGPNIVRNLSAVEGVRVVGIGDTNEDALQRATRTFPHIETTTDPDSIIRSP